MQKITVRRLLVWLPVALWMIVIFIFSAQPATASGSMSKGITLTVLSALVPNWEHLSEAARVSYLDWAHILIRKTAHVTEFAVLGGLLMNAFVRWYGTLAKKQVLLSLLCGVLYAASDEFHQMFVPARGPAVTDVLIDSAGVLIGVVVACLILRLLFKKHKKLSN